MGEHTLSKGWSTVAQSVSAPPDGSDAGEVVRWHRQRLGLTQQKAALLLNMSQSRLSKLEKSVQPLRDLAEMRSIAQKLKIPFERLGILPDNSSDAISSARTASVAPGPVFDSQQEWRTIRAELNANRAKLGDLAAELYSEAYRIPGTAVLTTERWMNAHPVDLSGITLSWFQENPKPTITGMHPASEPSRPLAIDGSRYSRYSHALRDIMRPRLLDNRVSFRLLDLVWAEGRASLGFGYTSYFDVLDICEVVAHEFASGWHDLGHKRPSLAQLPMRKAIADPFDLAKRPMVPSINTLTIRRDPIEGHRMYLHRRDPKAVAVAGGMCHVAPAGVFQPSSIAPAHQANDFSLWRNIQREFSEEFLGNPERGENVIDPIDYLGDEPFRSFESARNKGDLRIFLCATVVEPLTLWVEFLTVAVIEAHFFDTIFAQMVDVNEEGVAVSTVAGRPLAGIPFTLESRERLKREPLSPISRACIELAWQHRHTLLGS
ncbi:helix-turn-helix domain-containing protein [Nonomuraea sp. NPDC003754]